MKFKGNLIVSQSNWRYVYSSLLNFANEEVNFSYIKALEIYTRLNEDSSETLSNLLDSSFTDFHLSLIVNALTKESSNKIYKPKRSQFKKFNNRTTVIDLGDFKVSFDKVTNSVTFESVEFDEEFDDILKEVPFIGQFINMVETIVWPSKPGPIKAIRGVSIVYQKGDQEVQFYSAGPNPPNIFFNKNIVASEPEFLKTTSLAKVFIEPSITSETHHQIVHKTVDKDLL